MKKMGFPMIFPHFSHGFCHGALLSGLGQPQQRLGRLRLSDVDGDDADLYGDHGGHDGGTRGIPTGRFHGVFPYEKWPKKVETAFRTLLKRGDLTVKNLW